MRYSKGYTLSDCGPVAALNILKWAGMRVTYKGHIRHLKEACNYTNDDEFVGVRWWDIRDALLTIGKGLLRVRKYEVTDLQVLRRYISQGCAVVLRYRTSPVFFHYSCLLPANDGEMFLWLNHEREQPRLEITPEQFERCIMDTSQFGDVLIALLIRKI